MEEEKAAAYYDELSRKGEGAAKFKQGLGFSASSNSNDAVPSRGSALPSFLSNFVRASSPSKNAELEKQSQLHSIQNKLKKKPKEEHKTVSSSTVSKDRDCGNRSRRRSRSRSRSRDRHSRRSRSRDRHSKRRSRSRDRHSSRDDYSPKRRFRSRSTSRDRRKNRSVSPRNRRSEKRHKVGKARNSGVDYATVIEGYDKMTPAERVKAKMKLQLSETAERDETKGMGSGWERFDFDKDAPLDDEEIEAADDDVALVKNIGQTFRFSKMEARREEQIKAAHDEAIFGSSHPPNDETIFGTSSHPPFTDRDDETEPKSIGTSTTESAPLTSLVSDQVRTMQQGSWRDRARRA